MNCTDCKEKLIEYLEGLLVDSDKSAVEEHLKNCQVCRTELEELEELNERITSGSQTWQQTNLEEAVFNRIIREQNQRLKQAGRINRRFRIWRRIMNSKITKYATAAVIIVAAVLSVSIFVKSVPAAFGIEQVIDAYNNIRFLHVKQFRDNQMRGEFWIKSDELGHVVKARYYLPETEDGIKLITWTPERAEIWFKSKNGFLICQTNRIEGWMQSIKEQCQPRLVMQKLLEDQKAGKVGIDIQKPAMIVATYKAEPKKEIYYIDIATDLITRVEFYRIENNKEVLRATMQFCDYNVHIDEKMFSLKDDLPKDVRIADQLNQLIGVPQGDMTDEQAAEETIRQYLQALIDKDYKKAGLICCGVLEEYAKEDFGWCDVNAIISIGPPIPQPDWDEHGFKVPFELEIITKDGLKITCKDEQYVRPRDDEMHPDRWNITSAGLVARILLEAEILQTQIMTPKETAEAFFKGLTVFADFADGHYPSSLASMTAMQEVEAVIGKKLMSDPNYKPGTPPDKKIIEDAMSVQMVCMLYAKLARDGNEPAYYGDKVTTEFPDAVLLRWKMAEDQYKVIFGDLTTEEVTAAKLAELEAMSLNTNLFPIKPQPADVAMGAGIDELELNWMPGMDSIAQRIYFGEDVNALVLLDEVAEPCYAELPTLEKASTYYWRVDQLQTDGSVIAGDVWSFETGKLIALWTMDENDGNTISDSSGNNLHGTIKGDPQQTQGYVDGALKFDGEDDYVSIANDANFDITDAITVMCWINVDKFDRDWQTIVAKGDNTWRLSRNTGNGIHFACNGASNNYWGCINGKIDVNDSQWHHIAGVYDGSRICLYVDGNLDVSERASGKMVTDEFDVYIGENAECPNRFWNGQIDDVRIYSYPLSQSEITAICDKAQSWREE